MQFVTANKMKIVIALIFFTGLGVLCGRLGLHFWPSIQQSVLSKPYVYFTANQTLKDSYANSEIRALEWVMLLPPAEQEVLKHYQTQDAQTLQDLSSQILRSIEASTDQTYQKALISTNTVESFKDRMVSISGFIVPIDFYEDKSIKSLFLVPYFGACLHFPPPPPNQMFYARLDHGFSKFDFSQAYTLNGKMSAGLFEDPMGTSAYILEVVSITPFYGQPDNFRRH
jgi:uncharacterized protein